MKTFVNSWIPKLTPQLEQTEHRRMLSTIEALQQQHPLFEVMEQVRAQATEVPEDLPATFQNRQDFVLESEMEQCTSMVGERYGFDLQNMYVLYKTKIRHRKRPTSFKTHLVCIEHQLPIVDSESFIRLLIDFIVYSDVESSPAPTELIYKLPVTDDGDVYFFSPDRMKGEASPLPEEPDEAALEDSEEVEFALTEIFNYYARTYTAKPKDFDNLKEQLFTLSLRGYIAFTKDMSIEVDKARVVETWKKASINNQDLAYDEFKSSLVKLAVKSYRFKVEQH
jgi:hypothetical protein